MLTVKDLLKIKGEGVWAVSPETTAIDALRYMAEKNVGALLVLEGGILAGIISERDFVRRIAKDRDCDLCKTVQEYMTEEVVTVDVNKTIAECMRLMTEGRFRHLPVMKNNQLIGLISIGDVVKAVISDQSTLIQDLENYITGGGYGQ